MIAARTTDCRPSAKRRSFTIIELLISIAVITILASISLSVLHSVLEDAKEARTRAQIAKLNELIMRRWEEYQSRPVPIKILANTSPGDAARFRLDALRELMRMELPDRKSDVADIAVTLTSGPSLWRAYQRRAAASTGGTWKLVDHDSDPSTPDIVVLRDGSGIDKWSEKFQGAECLYMIAAAIQDGDGNGLDYFKPNEIGDLDGDGMLEILDGWGHPIEFLRWAPGFESDVQIIPDPLNLPPNPFDPFDPLHVDYAPTRVDFDIPINGFPLHPLIMSAGRDKSFDIYGVVNFDSPDLPPFVRYSIATNAVPDAGEPQERANSPYLAPDPMSILTNPPKIDFQLGSPADVDGSGELDDVDNITNHAIEVN